MRKYILFSVLAVTAMCFVACGSDDESDSTDKELTEIELNTQRLIGSWEKYETWSKSREIFVPVEKKDTLTFKADGTSLDSSTPYAWPKWKVWSDGRMDIGSFMYYFTFENNYTILQLRQHLGSDKFIDRYRKIQ